MHFQPGSSALAVLTASTLLSGAAAQLAANATCYSKACRILFQAGLSHQVFAPSTAEYDATISSYYAADVSDQNPSCIFKPETAAHVSTAIKALGLSTSKLHVAIRSGGHSPFKSVSNVDSGVTFDLGKLNAVTLDQESGTATVGTGARWGEVYNALEPQGFMVGGGREPHVGVGGFLLGGGFTWYSGKYGMAQDNVIGYEFVLADGSIVQVSATSNSDLFQALKGGLNNFGIVTRFTLRAFPARNVFGGVMAFPWTSRQGMLQAFVDMIESNRANPAESGFCSLSWSNGRLSPSAAFISANVDGVTDSPSFANLTQLSPLVDMRRVQPLTGLTAAISGGVGSYNSWYTLSFNNSLDMAMRVAAEVESVAADLAGHIGTDSQIIFVLTPLPKTYGEHGPSVQGLDRSLTGNSIVMQAESLMSSQADQPKIDARLQQAVRNVEEYAVSSGQLTQWLYINYANPSQKPMALYGAKNVALMKEVSAKYDPSGFFQKQVAGGYKVSEL